MEIIKNGTAKHLKKDSEKGFEGIDSSKGFAFWITDINTYEDWLKTGQNFARFSLIWAENNLYARPYIQITQEYEEMKNL